MINYRDNCRTGKIPFVAQQMISRGELTKAEQVIAQALRKKRTPGLLYALARLYYARYSKMPYSERDPVLLIKTLNTAAESVSAGGTFGAKLFYADMLRKAKMYYPAIAQLQQLEYWNASAARCYAYCCMHVGQFHDCFRSLRLAEILVASDFSAIESNPQTRIWSGYIFLLNSIHRQGERAPSVWMSSIRRAAKNLSRLVVEELPILQQHDVYAALRIMQHKRFAVR